MKRLAILFVFAAAALAAAAAIAQTTPSVPASSPLEAYRPLIQDIATLVITALSGLIARVLWVKWGIDVTADRRASFQIASTNAAGILARTGDMPRAVEYLKDAAPDAIKAFNIPDEKLPEKIEARAGIIEATGVAVPVITAVAPPSPSGL